MLQILMYILGIVAALIVCAILFAIWLYHVSPDIRRSLDKLKREIKASWERSGEQIREERERRLSDDK